MVDMEGSDDEKEGSEKTTNKKDETKSVSESKWAKLKVDEPPPKEKEKDKEKDKGKAKGIWSGMVLIGYDAIDLWAATFDQIKYLNSIFHFFLFLKPTIIRPIAWKFDYGRE